VDLFFPRADLSGLMEKKVKLPDRRSTLSGWVRLVFSQFLHESSRTEIEVFPSETILRHVFADDQGGLFLDFSNHLVSSSQVSTQLESLALKGLLRTLKKSLPGYRCVQLLVEGRERETLWGHIYIRKPFALERS